MIGRTLKHIHLPSPIAYLEASRIQEALVRRALDSRQLRPRSAIQNYCLTMQMQPVYTTGLRQRGLLTHDDMQDLRRASGGADVIEARRGGQTTFHGPGQLVAYPILDISPSSLDVRPRAYVELLEQVLIQVLSVNGIHGMRTGDTGVWVSEKKKIGSIGIHLRRNMTSHGIALNVDTDLSYFKHITACGLPDAEATSMKMEGCDVDIDKVTNQFVDVLARHLNLQVQDSSLHDECLS